MVHFLIIPTEKHKMTTVALIQARMSSSRLPGKVLQGICSQPMLLRVYQRVQRAKLVDSVAIITSVHEDDNAIEAICKEKSIPCFRGSLEGVLDRSYQSAIHFRVGLIVRLTADCPLLDPVVIDNVVQTFKANSYDYVSNTLECTYPDGLDTEVFRFEALEKAWREACLKSEREHVTSYIYKHPELFRLGSVKHEEDLSSLRWTVDTPQDLEFVRTIYSRFKGNEFGLNETLQLIREYPELMKLNAGQGRNEGYCRSLREDMAMEKEME